MLFIYLLFLLVGNVVTAEVQTCYYPDGSVSPHDTPCHSASIEDGASACCGRPDICLDNGLCLAQMGGEMVSRGSCTDRSWQSLECPQYCSDVNPSGGAPIFLLHYLQDNWLSCCSPGNPYNNTCMSPTKGSTAPISIEAGQVIFNRTSGSTSPNNTDTTPMTITATTTTTATVTATASASALSALSTPSASSSIPSPSSKTGTAVGAALSGVLGSLLLVTSALLYREKKRKQGCSKDAQAWELKYAELVQKQNTLVDVGGAEQQGFHGGDPSELYSKPHLIHQLEGWSPGEMEATRVP